MDATLFDSRFAGYSFSGDMALRTSWLARPSFTLAVGGFNPRFQPPPGFPSLRRITLPLIQGDNPRLRLESWLKRYEGTLIALGDAGAHVNSVTGFAYTTRVLTDIEYSGPSSSIVKRNPAPT